MTQILKEIMVSFIFYSIFNLEIATLPPKGMDKFYKNSYIVSHSVKSMGSTLRFSIPKPAPSRTVKRITKMRIDEIPFCESIQFLKTFFVNNFLDFHYPGQSKKYRSRSVGIPRKTI